MDRSRKDRLRDIPNVDRLLRNASIQTLVARYSRPRVMTAIRRVLDSLRAEILESKDMVPPSDISTLVERIDQQLVRDDQPYYRRVINATGVVLHTGLGRAPLSAAAVAAVTETAGHPQRVEIDLRTGHRGGRDLGCDRLIRELTGCDRATVVNNNAAATLLILAALARGRGVLISRGELVEIGGSFRIPEIMRESGAHLVEVGTTNRTHEQDYRAALNDEIGLILKVHPSNYRVVGFTCEASDAALIAIGREHGIPVAYDLGSGSLGKPVAGADATVPEVIASGYDIVCFSGDKLLGGPQAGIIAGRDDLVSTCRRHPLFRALRPGRLVYTALEATLKVFLCGAAEADANIPASRLLAVTEDVLRQRAEQAAEKWNELSRVNASAVSCASQAGSGSLPTKEYPSWGVAVAVEGLSAGALADNLRRGEPTVLARVRDDAVLLDFRTIEADEELVISRCLERV